MKVFKLYASAIATVVAVTFSPSSIFAQTTADVAKPYVEEWVFHVKWGSQDEWWRIFQKYQIATLEREKQLGIVTDFTVDKPRLHASDDVRWDYRITVTYPSFEASTRGDEITRQLFPDRATREREEQRRWELTLDHWDMPIEHVDPHG